MTAVVTWPGSGPPAEIRSLTMNLSGDGISPTTRTFEATKTKIEISDLATGQKSLVLEGRNDQNVARYRGSVAVLINKDQHLASEIKMAPLFTTPPSATTGSATLVTSSSATLNGAVNPNGSSATAYFEWGGSASYGNTTTAQPVANGNAALPVLANINGLALNTVYHFRLAVSDANGTAFGIDQSFASSPAHTWTQLSPTGGPPATRHGPAAVLDPTSNRMIVFGGGNRNADPIAPPPLNDVWVITNSDGHGGPPTWIQLFPAGTPPSPRADSTAVYDAANNLLIIFSGNTHEGYCEPFAPNDVWVLSHANGLGGTPQWTQLSPTGGPPNFVSRPLTANYDSSTNRLVVYGSHLDPGTWASNHCANPDQDQVWVLSNANGLGGAPTWTQLSPTGGPPPNPRFSFTTVYDPATNHLILFGGILFTGCCSLNDVWILSNANGVGGPPVWTQLLPAGTAPSARYEHTAVYDPRTNRMVIFGGDTANSVLLNEAWVLSNANGQGSPPTWTQLSPLGGPPAIRAVHSAVLNTASNRMVLFAGLSCASSCTDLNDTWVLNDANGMIPPALNTIAVTPAAPTINLGQTQPFTATGTFSDGSSRVLTSGGDTWTAKAPMPTARELTSVSELNGLLYVVGGYDGSSMLTRLEVYNPTTNTWATKTSMSVARLQMAGGAIDGLLYVAGGYNSGGDQSALEVYDPSKDTWTTKAPMPIGQQSRGAVSNGILYIVGGESHGSCISTVQAYNPATNSWTTKASMPTARCHLAVVADNNGLLYSIGGTDTTGSASYTNVEVYNPVTDTWTTKAPMPTGRRTFDAGMVNGIIYAVGGTNFNNGTTNNALTTVEAFDPATDTWTTKASLPAGRNALSLGAVNGILYAVGGAGNNNNSPLATNEAYTPTGEVIWSSSSTAVATIDQSGLATETSPGATTITAISGSLSGSAVLTAHP